MSRSRAVLMAAAAMAASLAMTQAASAACTRLAFSVNDYGKDGPTRDAKSMLDKYIAKWAADRKIKGYNTGPKAVSCELFLDFIVFDEYTCKAEATVCWNGPLPPGHQVEAGAAPIVNKAAQTRAKAPAKAATGGLTPAAAPGAAAPIATGSVRPAPAAAAPRAPAATAPRAPAAQPAAPAPAAAPAAPAAAPASN